MWTSSDRDYRNASIDFLRSKLPPHCIAATLTFLPSLDGRPLTIEDARGAVRMYTRRLNNAAYGNAFRRKKRRLWHVAVREGGPGFWDKHIHYHLQIETPATFEPAAWLATARLEWQRIGWASQAQNFFDVVHDERWLSYSFKLETKSSYKDAIDWENTWVN